MDSQTFRTELRSTLEFFLRPVRIFRDYQPGYLRADLIAGLTIAVILLPQAMAYALIAELPPQMGLYSAIVGSIVGAMWGSSNQLQTGPTNTLSLLVLSVLLTTATPGTPELPVMAGLIAVIAGVLQLTMGLARLGMLANFVSHSVIVGFSSGAGVLIAAKQLRHLIGLEFTSHSLVETIHGIIAHLPEVHWPTLALGLGTISLILLLRRLNPQLPAPLIAMAAAATAVGLLRLDRQGVVVIGQLPRSLPPLAKLPIFDLELIGRLSTGVLTVAAISLVETMSIARTIAGQTGQYLDSNQEFVGQGLAKIAAGLFSGYPCAGSFTRSAVNFKAGAQTSLSGIFAGLFVLIAMVALAPLAAYVPRTALAGVLILTAYGMIDQKEIGRIWRGARSDAVIMIVTFFGTLFLHLEFAVLTGILLSFGIYIMKTSLPEVSPVLPDRNFRHFVHRPEKPACPQLAILEILGDLYFGAVGYIEKAIRQHLAANPGQRFLLLRMHSVDQCDFSGIHALESIVRIYREQGGDMFMVRVHDPIFDLMKSTGFCNFLGADHFLSEDWAISHLFHRIIDPAICIYECDVRVFKECQNLPKRTYLLDTLCHTEMPTEPVAEVSPPELWEHLRSDTPPLVIDVREPREFEQGHIPQAESIPLPILLSEPTELPRDRLLVFVCRGGRRSTRATFMLQTKGYENIAVLRGGILAWEAAGLLEALGEPLIEEVKR